MNPDDLSPSHESAVFFDPAPWEKEFPLIRLMRDGTVVMIAAGVVLGAFLAQGGNFDWSSPILLTSVAAEALLVAASYVTKDLWDDSSRIC